MTWQYEWTNKRKTNEMVIIMKAFGSKYLYIKDKYYFLLQCLGGFRYAAMVDFSLSKYIPLGQKADFAVMNMNQNSALTSGRG